ncbi:hypothetical protein ISCGN_029453 [Ixodes scapularis]
MCLILHPMSTRNCAVCLRPQQVLFFRVFQIFTNPRPIVIPRSQQIVDRAPMAPNISRQGSYVFRFYILTQVMAGRGSSAFVLKLMGTTRHEGGDLQQQGTASLRSNWLASAALF